MSLSIPPPLILPIWPTRPAFRVTRSCLHTNGADESAREEGSAAYTHTRLINESSAALTNFPTLALGQPVMQASALTHERGHASP